MLVLMFMTVISTFIYETIFRDLQSIMGKLDYRTLRENVADEIRMKILNGDMKPGDKIIEQELASEFGISRGPVREALRQLEQDGLIERITDPNDRRKTLVRATEKGLAASRQCETALNNYFAGVMQHLTPQQRVQFHELKDALLDAVTAENAEQQSILKGDNQDG